MSKLKDVFKDLKKGAADTAPLSGSARRRLGKRSDPDYLQATAWIRRDTHRKVRVALINEGNRQDFGELVEDLLSDWLKKHS